MGVLELLGGCEVALHLSMFQQWKIFEMLIPGYLGFLPFALECFAMYVTAAWSLRLLKRQPHGEG